MVEAGCKTNHHWVLEYVGEFFIKLTFPPPLGKVAMLVALEQVGLPPSHSVMVSGEGQGMDRIQMTPSI